MRGASLAAGRKMATTAHALMVGRWGTLLKRSVSVLSDLPTPNDHHPKQPMSIIRGPRRTGNFYVLDKTISEDRRLTWAARGLLIYLLGKPDHWRVSPAALRNETSASRKPTGRDGVYALLDELMQAGYVTRTQERLPSGHLSEVHYMVSEESTTAAPLPALPLPALPHPALPYPANPTQVRIEGSKDLQKGRKEGQPARKTSPAPRPAPTAPSPSFENKQPEQPEQPPAPVADTLAPLVNKINAQRANNDKGAYTPADVAQLHAQAAKAGITVEQAAEWVLERSTRNFFQASYYTATQPAPAPTPPAPAPTPPRPAPTPEQLAENKRIADEHLAKIRDILKKPRR